MTAVSNSITVRKQFVWTYSTLLPSQQSFTSSGTYSWTAPAGFTSISVVCVGGGSGGAYGWSYGGGAGGGLGYKNNITVTPGSTYTVVVGAGGPRSYYNDSNSENRGGTSYFISDSTVAGFGGGRAGANSYLARNTYLCGGGYVGDGGGRGGNVSTSWTSGGAGAGGYSGPGGCIDNGWQSSFGGGQGDYYSSSYGTGAGGGIGLIGDQGTDRYGTYRYTPFTGYYQSTGSNGGGGGHGPHGANGYYGENPFVGNPESYNDIRGGNYGGGGGGSGTSYGGGPGGSGGVRIIWPGSRTFPSNAFNV